MYLETTILVSQIIFTIRSSKRIRSNHQSNPVTPQTSCNLSFVPLATINCQQIIIKFMRRMI